MLAQKIKKIYNTNMSTNFPGDNTETPYDKAEALKGLRLTMEQIPFERDGKNLSGIEAACQRLVERKILAYKETKDGRHFYRTYYVYNPETNNPANPNRWNEINFDILEIYHSYNVDPQHSRGWEVYHYTTKEYDSEGRMVKEKERDRNGAPQKEKANEYYADGNIKKKHSMSTGTSTEIGIIREQYQYIGMTSILS